MNLDEKLDNFYSSVIESATKQNIEIVENYKNSLQKVYDERKEAALRKAEAAYKIASEHIIRERNRRLSAETVEIRHKLLEKTSEIEESIFKDVEQMLAEYMKTEGYDCLLVSQIKNALEFAESDSITIYINPSDSDKKTSLEEKTGAVLTISDRDFIGGIRAVIPESSILIDNSFLTRLEEARSSFTLEC